MGRESLRPPRSAAGPASVRDQFNRRKPAIRPGDSHLRRHTPPDAAPGMTVVRHDEVGDAGRDLGAEARAVEHAEMADAELQVMRLSLGRNASAQPVRDRKSTRLNSSHGSISY